ncbi:energy transducer TonB [uncultured Maribacter sp.]|uniref:energy transducer TonB n=1 Tax=uncultured Maribacter sp. TaxID=431308 RepID=UPI00263676FE|nr:energy transducer TonB [uncultured Maribacter sp.]
MMTKLQLLSILFFTLSNLVFSQNKDSSIYFPQEQIILENCSDATDTNECLVTYFQESVNNKLHEKKYLKLISKQKKDTVYVGARLVFNPDQSLNKDNSYTWISGKKLQKLDPVINAIFLNTNIKEIANKKTPLISYHNLWYKFYIRKNGKETKLHPIPNKKKYTGGVVEKVPVFQGCENLTNKDARVCFNNQMEAHIRQHFRYPNKAQKMRLQGRVSIMFKINEEGTISNIKTKGPHKILEEEAIRIIKLIPKCEPGLINGKPTPIPFSIPISFRLQ